MDALYVESFSVKERVSETEEIKNSAIVEIVPVEIHEFNGQMLMYLDRLEKEISLEYEGSANFHFLFEKIKKKLKEQDFVAIQAHLNDLEELLDVNLPTMLLKQALAASEAG